MFMCSPFHVHKFCLLYTSHDTYLMLPFFFIFTLPLQQQQQAETWRDKETLCDTGDSPTDSRLHKNLQGWESTSVTIATPSGNLWLNPQRIWLLISRAATVSRGVGAEVHVRGLAWVRDDHRPAVIYLCWLVALSSSVWVAHCSIIHQTDDWPWQDAEPGGVCVCVFCVCRERQIAKTWRGGFSGVCVEKIFSQRLLLRAGLRQRSFHHINCIQHSAFGV